MAFGIAGKKQLIYSWYEFGTLLMFVIDFASSLPRAPFLGRGTVPSPLLGWPVSGSDDCAFGSSAEGAYEGGVCEAVLR